MPVLISFFLSSSSVSKTHYTNCNPESQACPKAILLPRAFFRRPHPEHPVPPLQGKGSIHTPPTQRPGTGPPTSPSPEIGGEGPPSAPELINAATPGAEVRGAAHIPHLSIHIPSCRRWCPALSTPHTVGKLTPQPPRWPNAHGA